MTEVREMTRSAWTFARSVMIASVIPSVKNSCWGSPEMFAKGSTAMETPLRTTPADAEAAGAGSGAGGGAGLDPGGEILRGGRRRRPAGEGRGAGGGWGGGTCFARGG